MKIPKKALIGILGIVTTAVPVVCDAFKEKIQQSAKKKEQERIYAKQKQNGMVIYATIIFSLVSIMVTILAIKQGKILLSIVGIFSFVAYAITFLYCLDIIKEKKHNIYKIVFLIGDILLVTVATLLFF